MARGKPPYPARGTEFGDQLVGDCADCRRELRRGDGFVVRLNGELLCVFCKDGIAPSQPDLLAASSSDGLKSA